MSRRRLSTAQVRQLAGELSERDRAILATVDQLRFVRGLQLERLHFEGLAESSRARRRRDVLNRLTRAQLLTRLERRIGGQRAGSAGHIYALGPGGQRLHQLQAGQPRRLRHRAEPSLAFLAHTLAVAETYTLIHDAGTELVTVEVEPDCWRTVHSGYQTLTLKPDLFTELAAGNLIYSWFIEIDLGTERRPALRRKAQRYLDAYHHGFHGQPEGSFPRVLWLVPDTKRAYFLAAALRPIAAPDGLFATAVQPSSPTALTELLTRAERAA
ncbi:MAG: replication-relaxation family protein [Acidimicrobiia bacterium]|nr:replication-relaxation family protein [Acidimicrobiia bacterium]